ncbi:MAG: hypothetical protein NVS9B14_17080 [Candidatus Acidiferrum sp.]
MVGRSNAVPLTQGTRLTVANPELGDGMSLIGLVHLAEKLFNQTQENPNDETSPASRSTKNGNAQGSNRTQSDEFDRPAAAVRRMRDCFK